MPTPPPDRRARIRVAAAIVALAAIAALFTHPPIAFAGTYTVHSCQTPSGTYTGPAGWTSAASVALAGYDSGSVTPCGSAGSPSSLQFGATGLTVKPGSWVSWDFVAPAGTSITSYNVLRAFNLGWPVISGVANRSYLMQVWHDDDVNAGLLDFKKPLQAGQSLLQQLPSDVTGEGVSWRSLHVSLSCWALVGSLDCGPFPAQVTISRAAIGLTDEVAPDGEATGGALVGPDPVRGTASLALHASDTGGGVYRVALAVDGTEVSRRVLDDAGGTCADVEPANDDPYEFGAAQPCPQSLDGALQLDTATLGDGTHHVRATVEDAAGNSAVVYDGTVDTHNAPIDTALPTLSGDAGVGGQLTASAGQWDGAPTDYDRRWLRCDADGAECVPVAGATGATYPLGDSDAYHRMRVEVTAANGSGSAVARSAPSAIVADGAGRTAPPSGGGSGDGGGSGGGSSSGGGTSGDGGGASGTGAPGGGSAGAPPPGGIQGIANPLGQEPGHVGNGSAATTQARLEVSFQLADGRTTHRVRLSYGRRATIVGRLTDPAGAAIAGARVGAAVRLPGRGWAARPGVRTDATGRFVYVLPAGPSRDVRFTYFAYSDSRAVELSNVVHADTLAALSIRADPRRVTGARVVRLRGRVGGESIPRAGLLVTLEGWQGGWGWRAFRTVRTDRNGRWSTRYRFRLSRGRFGFRALVPHQGDFPYATTRSGGVFVVLA